MATLNTLRTKMGWLLMVVIGLALLAFLLGDLSDSGSMLLNRNKMTVGEIAGESVGYEEFSNRMNENQTIYQLMTGSQSLDQETMVQVKNETWQNFLSNMVMEPSFASLGITISEAEQIDMVSGRYISPYMARIFINPQTGIFDQFMMRSFVANISIDPTGSSEALWQYFKQNMNRDRLTSKYVALVSGGMFVTDLQVSQAVKDNAKSYEASYVMESYSSIADSTINVSNAELSAYYNAHRNDFLSSAVRDVEYVIFNVLPSDDDYAQAARTVGTMAVEFAEAESPLQYAQLNSHTAPDTRYYKESELSGNMAIMAASGDMDVMEGPALNGTTYTMTCISDVKMLPDSIGAKHILLESTQGALADSLVTAVRGGASFEALATQYSLDTGSKAMGGDLGHFTPEAMIEEFSNAIVDSRVGDVYIVDTQFGIHVVQTTFKTPAVEKTQFATVVYEVEPSSYTDQNIYSNANAFFEQASGSADNFNAAVNSEALSKRVARIRSTDTNVSGLESSTELVRWAYNQEVGAVSSIMKIGDDYVIATLASVQEDGFAPLENVASDILPLVRREKKAEMLASRMQGSSLAEVAQAISGEVRTVSDITFASQYLAGLGVEPMFIGAATAVQQGALSKAVAGNMGVYKLTVTSSSDVDAPTAQDERVRLEAVAGSYIAERAIPAILLQADVKDYRVKFF